MNTSLQHQGCHYCRLHLVAQCNRNLQRIQCCCIQIQAKFITLKWNLMVCTIKIRIRCLVYWWGTNSCKISRAISMLFCEMCNALIAKIWSNPSPTSCSTWRSVSAQHRAEFSLLLSWFSRRRRCGGGDAETFAAIGNTLSSAWIAVDLLENKTIKPQINTRVLMKRMVELYCGFCLDIDTTSSVSQCLKHQLMGSSCALLYYYSCVDASHWRHMFTTRCENTLSIHMKIVGPKN